MQEQAINPAPTSVAEPPAVKVPAPDLRLLKRIQVLMWATAAGVALTIPAVLVVFIWPDFTLFSIIWQVLTGVSLSILASWVDRALLLPLPNGEMPNWWMKIGATRLRPHTISILNGIGSLYGLVSVSTIMAWWHLLTFKIGAGSFISCAIIYAFFVVIWNHPGGRLDRFLSKRPGSVLLYAIAVIGYTSFLWLPA